MVNDTIRNAGGLINMDGTYVKPVNDAPKFSSQYEKPTKIKVGIITYDLGGIAWVRDSLRHDKAVTIKAKPISRYWANTYNSLFRRW
jgi:hypothetical protein